MLQGFAPRGLVLVLALGLAFIPAAAVPPIAAAAERTLWVSGPPRIPVPLPPRASVASAPADSLSRALMLDPRREADSLLVTTFLGVHFETGGLAGTTRAPWLVAVLNPMPGVDAGKGDRASIRNAVALSGFRWSDSDTVYRRLPEPAWSPRILRTKQGDLALVAIADPHTGVFFQRARDEGRSWHERVRLTPPMPADAIEIGAPAVARRGRIQVPVLWRVRSSHATVLAVHSSDDAGATWTVTGTLPGDGVTSPALAETAAQTLLLAAHRSGEITRCTSNDGGATWSAWENLGITAAWTGIALASTGKEGVLALGWTDPSPDTTQAMPPLQALRVAFSTNGGHTWSPPHPIVLRPGRIPVSPALLVDGDRLVAAFVERAAPGLAAEDRIACLGYERRAFRAAPLGASSPQPVTAVALAPRARYGVDPAVARTSLRTLSAHTLARPAGPRRLFVEGYFMRTLAAAQDLADSLPRETPAWFDAQACGRRALAWADSIVAAQSPIGYWSTGYGAVYVADMAAALGIFPALEHRATPDELRRWEASARRFVQALEEDGMIGANGACGVGWPGAAIPRVKQRASRVPYLVSTALAGIELHAWLAHRGGQARDRERALLALEWTLSQVEEDGSLPAGPMLAEGQEGALLGAAYVQEGWMAADRLLDSEDVRLRLRAVLPRHVAWILQAQRADGAWDHGADGEFARTPAIVNFLVWYDRRIESRADVRQAIQRAGLRLADPARWAESGLFHAGNHHEVLRAHGGRVLAALGREGPVW